MYGVSKINIETDLMMISVQDAEFKGNTMARYLQIFADTGVVVDMISQSAPHGTTDEIFYQPGHEYTKGLINSIPKLNTAEHERLVPIEGTPVDLLNPPAGCPFAPRCKNCMKICLSKMPPRTELSDTHYTYCWLQQKAAFEKGEKAE